MAIWASRSRWTDLYPKLGEPISVRQGRLLPARYSQRPAGKRKRADRVSKTSLRPGLPCKPEREADRPGPGTGCRLWARAQACSAPRGCGQPSVPRGSLGRCCPLGHTAPCGLLPSLTTGGSQGTWCPCTGSALAPPAARASPRAEPRVPALDCLRHSPPLELSPRSADWRVREQQTGCQWVTEV